MFLSFIGIPQRAFGFFKSLGLSNCQKTSKNAEKKLLQNHDERLKSEISKIAEMKTKDDREGFIKAENLKGVSFFADNVGKSVVSRFNTGIENRNHYDTYTLQFATLNRVGTLTLSDEQIPIEEIGVLPENCDFGKWIRFDKMR